MTSIGEVSGADVVPHVDPRLSDTLEHTSSTAVYKRMLTASLHFSGQGVAVGVLGREHVSRPEAVAAFLEAIRLGDDSPDTQVVLAQAYAKSGQPEKAREILKRLEAGKEYVSPVGLAYIHAALGEREQALALLERAFTAHDQELVWLGLETRFNPDLRSDPRFGELIRRVGLPTADSNGGR